MENKDKLELARNVAKFAAQTETKPGGVLNLGYFIGVVVGYSGTKIQVQRPFDLTVLTLPYVSSASGLSAGAPCFVLVPGCLANAIVLGDGKLSNL